MKHIQEMMRKNILVKHRSGSHAYGTATPESDLDLRGIFAADKINVMTPFFPVKECVDLNEEDTKLYELSHFMKLCLDCNPNIIETLWIDKEDILVSTDAYWYLREYREYFLSSKIAFTTSGYSHAQLLRMKNHHKWINNPQSEESPKPKDFLSIIQWFGKDKNLKPSLSEFNDNHRLIPYGANLFGVYPWKHKQLWNKDGYLNQTVEDNRPEFDIPLMFIRFNENEYLKAKDLHQKYWTWKKNRNKVRSALEEKYSYDSKHATHLVRLLRMGVEALRDGVINVKRNDAEELLAIRNGAWSYEELIEYADSMDHHIRNDLYHGTKLRKKPDIKLAAKVLMEVQEMVWKNNS